MKKVFVILLLTASVLSLHARGIQEDYKKAEEKAKVSYAAGLLMGSNLRSVELEFDYAAFTEGFKAAMGDAAAQFSEQEAVEIVETALQKAIEKKAEENRLFEEEFLAMNGQRPGVLTTDSGLQYEIIVETNGEKPESDSVVRVHYEGSFADGSPFDSSDNESEGALIPLEMVIPGWTEGIMLMGVGSKYCFYIPSELAYGKEGFQSLIPPYSTLVFTVELLEIMNPDSEQEDDESEES